MRKNSLLQCGAAVLDICDILGIKVSNRIEKKCYNFQNLTIRASLALCHALFLVIFEKPSPRPRPRKSRPIGRPFYSLLKLCYILQNGSQGVRQHLSTTASMALFCHFCQGPSQVLEKAGRYAGHFLVY